MGLFDKLREPIVLKESSDAKTALEELDKLLENAPTEIKEQIEYDKRLLYYGVKGEESLIFELKNSHIPMYILHDVFFEENNLKTQIDYIVITRKLVLILECKNLYGNISIDNQGNFTRTIQYGKRYRKEGIYSPITQNQRHLDMIREKRRNSKGILGKMFFDKYFDSNYKSIVVLANSKSVLDMKYAPKEIKAQIVKVDGLINYIKRLNSESTNEAMTDKQMKEIAEFFLSNSVTNSSDFTSKYKIELDRLQKSENITENINLNIQATVENDIPAIDNTASLKDIASDNNEEIKSEESKNNNDIESLPVYRALKEYRYMQSKIENIKAYYIFNNSQLELLIRENPKTIDELKGIKGFADVKCSKYGEEILKILSQAE